MPYQTMLGKSFEMSAIDRLDLNFYGQDYIWYKIEEDTWHLVPVIEFDTQTRDHKLLYMKQMVIAEGYGK